MEIFHVSPSFAFKDKEQLNAYIQEHQALLGSSKKWEQLRGLLGLDRIYRFESMVYRSQARVKNKPLHPKNLAIQQWLSFEKAMQEDRAWQQDFKELNFMKGGYLITGKHFHPRDDLMLENAFPIDLGTGIWSQYLAGNQAQNTMIFYFKIDQQQQVKIQLSYQGKPSGFIDQHYLTALDPKDQLFLDQGGWEMQLGAGIHRLILLLDGAGATFLLRLTDAQDQPLKYQHLSQADQQGQMPTIAVLDQLYLSQGTPKPDKRSNKAQEKNQAEQQDNAKALEVMPEQDIVLSEIKVISLLSQMLKALESPLSDSELLGIAMYCQRLGLEEKELTQLFYEIDIRWQKKKSFNLWEAMLFVSQKDLLSFPYLNQEPAPQGLSEELRWLLGTQLFIKNHLYHGRFEESREAIEATQKRYPKQAFLIEQELALLEELNLKQQAKQRLFEEYELRKKQGFDWIYLKKLYFYLLLRLDLYHDANVIYSELLNQREDDFELQFTMFSYWTKYQLQEGIDFLKKLITQNERTWVVYSEIAELAYRHRLWEALFSITFPIIDHPDILMLKAKALMILGEAEQAKITLVQLLLQKPEDQQATELLNQLEPQKNEQLLPSLQTILMLKKQSQAWIDQQKHSAIYLLDQHVLGIDEQGREFNRVRQLIEINQSMDTSHPLAIQYMIYHPSRERLKVYHARRIRGEEQSNALLFDQHEISEPDARMYYDLVAKAADFGQLKPGDLLELDYEISRLQPNPTFEAYFSELFIWQGRYPKLLSQLALTPRFQAQLQLHAQSLNFKNIRENPTSDGTKQWSAMELPAIDQEELQPAVAQPYVAMSNFKNWTALAQGYQALILPLLKDDLFIKEELQEWLQTLKIPKWPAQATLLNEEEWERIKGIEEKLRIIYDKITHHIRYVGLEFGNHSYEPALPQDTWKRGFGDCKDRAILMILMAKSMGIQLDFVMIRTNGRPPLSDQESIAGLNFFNHAIVYSPDLKRYFDPTAIEFDPFVLPFDDQWGQVLHIDTQAEIKEAKLGFIDQNPTKKILLSLKGNAQNEIEINGYFHGENAAYNRRLFQDSNANHRFLTHYLLPSNILSLEHANQQLDVDFEESLLMSLDQSQSLRRDPFLARVLFKPSADFDILFWPKKLALFERYAPVTPRTKPWKQVGISLAYQLIFPCHSPLWAQKSFTMAQFQKSKLGKPVILENKGFFTHLKLQYQSSENEEQCLFDFSFEISSAHMSSTQVTVFKDELNQAQQLLNQSLQ